MKVLIAQHSHPDFLRATSRGPRLGHRERVPSTSYVLTEPFSASPEGGFIADQLLSLELERLVVASELAWRQRGVGSQESKKSWICFPEPYMQD